MNQQNKDSATQEIEFRKQQLELYDKYMKESKRLKIIFTLIGVFISLCIIYISVSNLAVKKV